MSLGSPAHTQQAPLSAMPTNFQSQLQMEGQTFVPKWKLIFKGNRRIMKMILHSKYIHPVVACSRLWP